MVNAVMIKTGASGKVPGEKGPVLSGCWGGGSNTNIAIYTINRLGKGPNRDP